jgi:hypothetical protein
MPINPDISNAIDPGIIAAIKAAPTQGNLFSVVNKTDFVGQVLKADVIGFETASTLVLSNLNVTWLAIVAKTFKFAAPRQRTIVHVPTDSIYVRPGAPIPQVGKAAKGGKGGQTAAGGRGTAGAPGANGHRGTDAPKVPALIIATNTIESPARLPSSR